VSEGFLRDLDDVDPALSVWAKARRQAFHDQLLQRLQAFLASDTRTWATRRECARAILNLDPTHEETCRALMRINAEMGDTAAALRAYNALWELLDSEYDTEPSPGTMALVAEIKQGTVAAAATLAKASELFPQPAPPREGQKTIVSLEISAWSSFR
jgi:DNA-binding SARP family transcriptional activator